MHSKDSSIVPDTNHINYLPEEILIYLFHCMKKSELMKLMAVCKRWNFVSKKVVSAIQAFERNPFVDKNISERINIEIVLDKNEILLHTEIFVASNRDTRICFLSNQEIKKKWANVERKLTEKKFLLMTTSRQDKKNNSLYIFGLETRELVMMLSFFPTPPQHEKLLFLIKNDSFIALIPNIHQLDTYNFSLKELIICNVSSQTIICKKISSLTDIKNDEFDSLTLSKIYERKGRYEFEIIQNEAINNGRPEQVLVEYYNSNDNSPTLFQKNEPNYQIFSLSDGRKFSFRFPFQKKLTQDITILKLDFQHELAYYQYSANNKETLFFYKNNFAGTNEQVFQTTYPLTPEDKFFEALQYHRLVIASVMLISNEISKEIPECTLTYESSTGTISLPFTPAPGREKYLLKEFGILEKKGQKAFVIQIWDTVTCKLLKCFSEELNDCDFQIEKIFKKNGALIILTSQNETSEKAFHIRTIDLKELEKNNFHYPKIITKVKRPLPPLPPWRVKINRHFLSIDAYSSDCPSSSNDQTSSDYRFSSKRAFEVFNLYSRRKIFKHPVADSEEENFDLAIADNNKTVIVSKASFNQKTHSVTASIHSYKQLPWLSDKTVPNTTHPNKKKNQKPEAMSWKTLNRCSAS